MRNALDAAIRKKLIAYLAGRVSLTAFHTWFVPATWDTADSAPPPLRDLIYEISLRLAEYTGGYLTENQLREKFKVLINTIIVDLSTINNSVLVELNDPLQVGNFTSYGQILQAAPMVRLRHRSTSGERYLLPTL